MISFVLLSWLMAVILLLVNIKQEKTRWGSYMGFCEGFGGLGIVLGKSADRPDWIIMLDGISTSIGHYWTPYVILIFGLLYTDMIKTKRMKRMGKILLVIPTILAYTPIFSFSIYPEFNTNFSIIALWIIPYILITCLLLILSVFREKRTTVKNHKMITCIIVVPLFLFVLLTNVILPVFGIRGGWQLNPLIMITEFLFFIYFSTRYGFLGVKIKFEKQRLSSTMQAVTSGTTLLNHTIKNEMSKIDLVTKQLKKNVSNNAIESLDLILNSTQHLLELSSRIQGKLGIMELKETKFLLSDLIQSSLDLMKPHLFSVTVIKRLDVDVQLYGDFIHLEETCINIVKNALEAMNYKGTLIINVNQTKKGINIEFADDGKGIKKENVSKIVEPFYSTKKEGENFGLGLTYCFNVMAKHGGDIVVDSQLNLGTSIRLFLPKKRIVSVQHKKKKIKKLAEEMTYG
ncbi:MULTISPECIES: sensor histidine kinase [Niallia]|uniref:sensor histidine kinase n=1 Tax=Niallia TaxID=2837506 RepID=UPI001EDAAB5F|nr:MULTISPECIES: HAMP domain-containing sensor histidine kinase [Niallia]MED4041016.1 HAMP domain-containing sensor histidine kinase [Niallia taxi]UPO90964.1 HAMP domain-containing histidine kinase [Niallia sp. Man26]